MKKILLSYEAIDSNFIEICDSVVYKKGGFFVAHFLDFPDIICIAKKRHLIETMVKNIIKKMYAQEGRDVTVIFYESMFI